MTSICPWLGVAEDGGRILAFAGLCPEEGETLQSLQTECADTFQGIERYVRAVVDRDGRLIWDGEALTWRYGTLQEALALGARADNVEHIVCGFDFAPAIRNVLPDRCECDRCCALRGGAGGGGD